MKRIRLVGQQGFTILELMIATAVLSILLLLASGVFIAIGNIYTKGVTGTQLQDNVRNLAQQVAGIAQYSVEQGQPGTNGPDGEQAYCIGSDQFTYVIDKVQGVDTFANGMTVQHVLWESTNNGSCTALSLATTPATGTDLGIDHEGLHSFDINDDGKLIDITIDAFEAAGDDLLVPLTLGTDSACKGNTGDQFCFTAQLTTTVQRRV